MTTTPTEPPVHLITADVPSPDPEPAPARYIWLLIFAVFGVFMAFVTPLGISLAIRIDQLAAGHAEYLGYITGAGGAAALVTTAAVGMLSDRTRSRLGRRRPWLIAGTVLGLVSLLVMAQAPSIPVLGLGWVLAQMGWGSVFSLLLTSQADRLSEAQRGKVAGLSGVVQQLAPVMGVLLAGSVAGDNLLLFLLPSAAAIVAMTLFILFISEPDSRTHVTEPLTGSTIARTFLFNPRQHPDFAWNWLGRFLFNFGLTFATTFTAFLFAERMDLGVDEVAGTMASVAGVGILMAMLGAMGGGFLSDKLRRRKVFIMTGAIVFAVAVTIQALAPTVALLLVGAVLVNLGLGIFSAVDQALVLDVLPAKETEAGRFTAINGFSTSIAQSTAPIIAPALLAVGAAGADKNYTLLYLVAAAITVIGGLIVVTRVKSVR